MQGPLGFFSLVGLSHACLPERVSYQAWKLQVPVPAMVSALLLVLVTLWAYPTCPSDFGLGAVPGLGCAREVLILKRSR